MRHAYNDAYQLTALVAAFAFCVLVLHMFRDWLAARLSPAAPAPATDPPIPLESAKMTQPTDPDWSPLPPAFAGLLIVLYAWHLPPFSVQQSADRERLYPRHRHQPRAAAFGLCRRGRGAGFPARDAGQVIARIDDRQYRQKLAQAQAALQGAEAALKIQDQSVRSAQAGQHRLKPR